MSFGVEIFDAAGDLYLSTDSIGLVPVDYFLIVAGADGQKTYSELQGVSYRHDLFFVGGAISAITAGYDDPPIEVTIVGNLVTWSWVNTDVLTEVTMLVWAE